MAEQMRKALITGGKGFIGNHLSRQLDKRGYHIEMFDMTEGNDATNRDLVFDRVQGYDVIFHLAGVLGTHELNTEAYEATRINVGGALNIYDAAVQSGARVVLAAKPNPWLNVYSITKETAEKFGIMYAQMHGLDFRAGRFFSLYGPGQKIHGVQKAIPTFIVRALGNEPIPVFGTGNQTADFIHAEDATEALVILGHMENAHGEIVEIGTGEPTTVNFLANLIIKLCKSKSKIEHIPMRSGEPLDAQVVADTSKMTTLLQFSPKITLEDGLKETIDWYRKKYFDQNTFVSMPA